MYKKRIIINSLEGLHIRLSVKIVKQAKKFFSNINILLGTKLVNAKSLFKILTLNLVYGKKITIIANGTDEKKAVISLYELILKFK